MSPRQADRVSHRSSISQQGSQQELGSVPGVYVLLLEARRALAIGRLGLLDFDGWYLYVGSALGPGGLKRVERHFNYRRQGQRRPRWHIDGLLASGALRGALVAPTDQRRECELARMLRRHLIPAWPGFGSSDCSCSTHLFLAPSAGDALAAARRAFAALGLDCMLVEDGCRARGSLPSEACR